MKDWRKRRRPPPRPFQAGGPSWALDRLRAPKALRRAAIVAIAVHLLGAAAYRISLTPRAGPPIRLTEIPVHLVSPPPIAPGGSRRRTMNAAPISQKRPPQTAAIVKPKPVPGKGARPIPVKKLAKAEPIETREEQAADTTHTLMAEVPFNGGGEGILEMSVDGPMSAYTYYLMTVRDKVASNWNPPAGLVASGKDVSAQINFRIDRRGKVVSSYVEEPSGTGVFDAASLRAVAQSDPLPPLPQEYMGDWLGIHLRFVYRED